MTNLLILLTSFVEINQNNIVFPNQFFYRKMELCGVSRSLLSMGKKFVEQILKLLIFSPGGSDV